MRTAVGNSPDGTLAIAPPMVDDCGGDADKPDGDFYTRQQFQRASDAEPKQARLP